LWETAVIDAYRRGYDIQLHIHPQWNDAVYENGQWRLNNCWDITKYPEQVVREMFIKCGKYLLDLLKKESPAANIVSFRAGSWGVAPSDFMLNVLADNRISIDVSMVGCIDILTSHFQLDYTSMEEKFLPYYPNKKDARFMSECEEPVVCVPNFCFYSAPRDNLLHLADKTIRVLIHKNTAKTEKRYKEGNDLRKESLWRRVKEKIAGREIMAEISGFSRMRMNALFKAICAKSAYSKQKAVPIILQTHTKAMKDFSPLEYFLDKCRKQPNMSFITITQMKRLLDEGVLPVVKK
jgi:hypothetical protein